MFCSWGIFCVAQRSTNCIQCYVFHRGRNISDNICKMGDKYNCVCMQIDTKCGFALWISYSKFHFFCLILQFASGCISMDLGSFVVRSSLEFLLEFSVRGHQSSVLSQSSLEKNRWISGKLLHLLLREYDFRDKPTKTDLFSEYRDTWHVEQLRSLCPGL